MLGPFSHEVMVNDDNYLDIFLKGIEDLQNGCLIFQQDVREWLFSLEVRLDEADLRSDCL